MIIQLNKVSPCHHFYKIHIQHHIIEFALSLRFSLFLKNSCQHFYNYLDDGNDYYCDDNEDDDDDHHQQYFLSPHRSHNQRPHLFYPIGDFLAMSSPLCH